MHRIPPGASPEAHPSIADQMTRLYVFVDDFLKGHPALAQRRHSPNAAPADADALTVAVLRGCFGCATLRRTHELAAANWRGAFPRLPPYGQWVARLPPGGAGVVLALAVGGGVVLADLGYRSKAGGLCQTLAEEAGVLLIHPADAGGKGSERRALVSSLRERVETAFSGLCARFIARVLSRS